MMMPQLDGYKLTRIIRSDLKNNRVKSIALTANALVGEEQKCIDVGCDYYSSKPINITLLLNTVELALTNKKKVTSEIL